MQIVINRCTWLKRSYLSSTRNVLPTLTKVRMGLVGKICRKQTIVQNINYK
jgi:hypothetical protein